MSREAKTERGGGPPPTTVELRERHDIVVVPPKAGARATMCARPEQLSDKDSGRRTPRTMADERAEHTSRPAECATTDAAHEHLRRLRDFLVNIGAASPSERDPARVAIALIRGYLAHQAKNTAS